jgi:hypothetical protein
MELMANDEMVEAQQSLPLEDTVDDYDNQTDSNFGVEEPKVTVQEAHKPEDIAAAFFRLNKAKLERQLVNMSAKQMRRLLMNVCSYPFVDKAYMPKDDEERQIAHTVHEMLLNRTIMQLSFEMQAAEKAAKIQTEEKNEPTTPTD